MSQASTHVAVPECTHSQFLAAHRAAAAHSRRSPAPRSLSVFILCGQPLTMPRPARRRPGVSPVWPGCAAGP